MTESTPTFVDKLKCCLYTCGQYAMKGLPYFAAGLAVGAAAMAGIAINRRMSQPCPYCPSTTYLVNQVLGEVKSANNTLYDMSQSLYKLESRVDGLSRHASTSRL